MSARPGYLFVLPWTLDSIGGVSVAVRGIATAMRRQGSLRPIVMVLDWRSPRVVRVPDPDLEVCSLRIPDPLGQSSWRTRTIALLVTLPLSMLRLAAFLRRENIEVVNFHYPGLHCVAVLLLRAVGLYRGRVVLSFHGRDVTTIREETRPWRRRLWRLALARVDASVACSESLAKEVASLEGAAAGRVEVIGNGVDSSAIRRMASVASGAPQLGRPYVLCLATYEHKKGLDVLVDAFRAVADARPEIDLVVCGRRGESFDDVVARIRARGLEPRVHVLFDVPHERAIGWLDAARLLVLPSRNEPFGLVVLEAAVLGVPVVATSVCGVVDVVPRNLLAVVPPDDAAALADAILVTLNDEAAARSRAAELGRFVEARLSWSAAADAYAAFAAVGASAARADAPSPR